jgi:L-arabinokinase
MIAAGRLMYGSHRSYSRNCGLGSKETDLLVSLVRGEGPAHGLLGAKITGGGSGGTVAVLVEADGAQAPAPPAMEALERVSLAYEGEVGRRPRLIQGSLPGAESIAPVELSW